MTKCRETMQREFFGNGIDVYVAQEFSPSTGWTQSDFRKITATEVRRAKSRGVTMLCLEGPRKETYFPFRRADFHVSELA
jgi:hypothetical protein